MTKREKAKAAEKAAEKAAAERLAAAEAEGGGRGEAATG